ncbi:hypothetical protein WN982_08550 [Paraburkholderia sp. IMGN_8]|uniref:hypothetical protein n=1 Tax=Paraburkholderia sp. IMGN_8 TaxID=3136564 RepID=UPI0031011BCD
MNRNGVPVGEFKGTPTINGPWGLTIFDQVDHAKVFVSNVLGRNVVRLDVTVVEALQNREWMKNGGGAFTVERTQAI